MAWKNITVEINGVTFLGHEKDGVFSLPFSTGLEKGDTFKVRGKSYQVIFTDNFLGRDEILLINAIGVKNDKSKARRVPDNTGRPEL